jgi:hypothetical protein
MSVLLAAALTFLAPQDPPPERIQRPEPLPIPSTGILRRGERRIVVDGSLQDWPPLPPIRLDDVRQVSGTAFGAFRSLDDLAGKAFLLWDEEDLYLSIQVLDDWHIGLTEDSPRVSEIPPADAVVISFDPLRDTRTLGMDPGRGEDAEFWLADVVGQERKVVRWDRFRGVARFADGAAAVVARDAERRVTTYEARIPWREILPVGRHAGAGMVCDMQIVLNDFDEPTDPLPQTRIGWNFGMGPRIDPGLFGSAILLDQHADAADVATARLPEIPPAVDPDELPVPDEAYWIGLKARIDRTRPEFVVPGIPDPAFAGGKERHDVLAELDGRLASFPRVDHLEFLQRVHRRMNREAAGIATSGVPYFWDHALDGLARRASIEAPERGMRLFRLPQGGLLVRSAAATFAIDPAGYRVDHALFDLIDFVLLTRPLELTERQDQLLMRMAAARPPRPVFIHVAVHMPGLDIRELPLVVPGDTYDAHGLLVKVLGVRDEAGLVTPSVGYQVLWPDGTDLVVTGTEMLEEMAAPRGDLEVLVLSVRHPRARIIGQRLAADLSVLDDTLECAFRAGSAGRVGLEACWELQNGLLPRASVILAPGESLEIGG